LQFEQVRENDTRKTSNVAFQTLRFERIRENEIFVLRHPHGKQATLFFSNVLVCAICEKRIIIKKLRTIVGFLRESIHRILTTLLRAKQIFKKEFEISV
jgi:hypothetical protein